MRSRTGLASPIEKQACGIAKYPRLRVHRHEARMTPAKRRCGSCPGSPPQQLEEVPARTDHRQSSRVGRSPISPHARDTMREQQPRLGFQTSGDRRDQGPSAAGAEEKQTSTVFMSKPRGREAGYTEHYTRPARIGPGGGPLIVRRRQECSNRDSNRFYWHQPRRIHRAA
jgi:hypothetical protein